MRTIMHEGTMCFAKRMNYSNGVKSDRIYSLAGELIDVMWVVPIKAFKPSDIIEHREVQIYNRYFC